MSTSSPLCCVAMELAARLEASRLQLDLDWVPRELNQEADDLPNGIFDKFDPELRVPVDLDMVQWQMLDRLMKEGAEYYDATTRAKRARQGDPHGAQNRYVWGVS